ncbi:hypothetical protein Acr_10g0002100 [Actinidia rufa]|uniref:Uncharacterized protein n=1 Tax=Actinidia rufa TaxID=165716 RepID=A0A7J0F800_9ERIC|nr:hypothetical protein Acr_10g0002100 [Actinidia rufa]
MASANILLSGFVLPLCQAPPEDVEDSKMVKSEEVRPANDVEYKTMKDVQELATDVEHKRTKDADEPAKDVEHETMKYEEESAKLSELKSTAKPGQFSPWFLVCNLIFVATAWLSGLLVSWE